MTHVISGRYLLAPPIEDLPEPPSNEQVLREMIAFMAAGMRAARVQVLGWRSEDAA
jgi:hypothetical protein